MTKETSTTKSEETRLASQSDYVWSFVPRHSWFIGHWSLVILFLLCGCAVGPNYQRPAVDSPAVFRGDSAPTNTCFADLDWWQVYQDAILQALVHEALTNN